MGSNLWSTYVLDVAPRGGHKQSEIAERVGVSQGAISKWVTGKAVPDEAAPVAAFARAFGRNVLEAFVAAGLLTESEAGRGLPPKSREYLAELRDMLDEMPAGVEPATYRALRKRWVDRSLPAPQEPAQQPAPADPAPVEKVKRHGERA